MGADSRQGRPHRKVQRSKRGAATLECVRSEAGNNIRPRYRRPLRGDPLEFPDQHSLKMMARPSQRLAPGQVKVVPAKPEDIVTVLGILDEAALWILEEKLPSV